MTLTLVTPLILNPAIELATTPGLTSTTSVVVSSDLVLLILSNMANLLVGPTSTQVGGVADIPVSGSLVVLGIAVTS